MSVVKTPAMRWFSLALLLLLRTCLAQPAFADDTVRAMATPRTVILHLASPQEFARACWPGARACSRPERPTCEIWLNAGFDVWGDPSTQYAGFNDAMKAAEVAHELLHCLVGRWHPE